MQVQKSGVVHYASGQSVIDADQNLRSHVEPVFGHKRNLIITCRLDHIGRSCYNSYILNYSVSHSLSGLHLVYDETNLNASALSAVHHLPSRLDSFIT